MASEPRRSPTRRRQWLNTPRSNKPTCVHSGKSAGNHAGVSRWQRNLATGPVRDRSLLVASVDLTPQATLAGVQIEPDVPGIAPRVGDDPADLAAAFRGTGFPRVTESIGERIAATIPRPTRDLLRPRHHLSDPFLGELRCHKMSHRCRPWSRPNPGGSSCCRSQVFP